MVGTIISWQNCYCRQSDAARDRRSYIPRCDGGTDIIQPIIRLHRGYYSKITKRRSHGYVHVHSHCQFMHHYMFRDMDAEQLIMSVIINVDMLINTTDKYCDCCRFCRIEYHMDGHMCECLLFLETLTLISWTKVNKCDRCLKAITNTAILGDSDDDG